MFELFNERGYKVVGADYANLCFYGKGRVDVPAQGIPIPMAPGGTLNFYRSSHPLIEQGGHLYLAGMTVYDSGLRLRNYRSTAGTAGWVEYWSFGPVSEGDSPFELRTPDGRLMFNAARPFLRVLGQVSVTSDNITYHGSYKTWEILPFTAPMPFKGDHLAFAIGNAWLYQVGGQINLNNEATAGIMRRITRAMHISGGLCQFSGRNFHPYPNVYSAYYKRYSSNAGAPMTMLVADVSGL